ncbi:hypothetical protein M5689_016931 [Euphorbia peplus]|nr:hypothetical protein M5689_016931 [Euphorbia peplus]
MDFESSSKALTKKKKHSYNSTNIIPPIFAGLSVLILVQSLHSFTYHHDTQWRMTGLPTNEKNTSITNLISKLRDSVTFLPLKDLRFSNHPMEGHTWFMSSLHDTRSNQNKATHLYFPSEMSKGRLICFKGNNTRDGTANSYALAWPESLPHSAKLVQGLTFVSETYYDHVNLWHGLDAMIPFVSWSMSNECIRPDRWLLFHWGEVRSQMGSWLEKLMQPIFGDVKMARLEDVPHCFERAVVMRDNGGGIEIEKKLDVYNVLRCKARRFCGLDEGKSSEVDENGEPIIRLTLLMRRGSRSFKNATAVIDIFSRECAKVQGCVFKVAHSEDLSFCDQVKVMSYTDIVASPHGAQLTNMMFMDRNSSVMEFFPKGWLELAGVGRYVFHWIAVQSGMIHQGAWWEPLDNMDCPSPHSTQHCFSSFKNGKLGHNETHFAQWTTTVLNQVKARKQAIENSVHNSHPQSTPCSC